MTSEMNYVIKSSQRAYIPCCARENVTAIFCLPKRDKIKRVLDENTPARMVYFKASWAAMDTANETR
jgi:hypothetical protein